MMPRTIRPGPRPFVALGVVCSVMLCVLAIAAFRSPAQGLEFLKGGAFFLVVFGTISLGIWRTRIIVSDRSIATQSPLGRRKEIKFQDISRSVIEILAEPEHPIALHIFGMDTQAPVLSLGLKPYRKADVWWLIELPGLKTARR